MHSFSAKIAILRRQRKGRGPPVVGGVPGGIAGNIMGRAYYQRVEIINQIILIMYAIVFLIIENYYPLFENIGLFLRNTIYTVCLRYRII